ncbi:TetR/AcrR family transcriptional regulator [Brevundimonas sp.]|uniref:TetR/AcrR family transcriptional regulator n=1 Tax=Brevundimonas sp. TaxID=1871086 RepID=UPI0025F7CD16|nr:TetR/AcrR family transcriptional regulator [Brevundimonas sp.]
MDIQTPEHAAKRRVILSAARRRFMADGYAAAAMERISREAGISTATLYAHFPGKAELFHHVIIDASEEFAGLIRTVRMETGSPRDRLRSYLRAYARFMADPFVRAVFRLVTAERKRFRETAHTFFEMGKRDVGAGLMASLREMTEAGLLDVRKPSWAAGQLLGMVEHPLFLAPMITGDDVVAGRSPDSIADDAVETFLARYEVRAERAVEAA